MDPDKTAFFFHLGSEEEQRGKFPYQPMSEKFSMTQYTFLQNKSLALMLANRWSTLWMLHSNKLSQQSLGLIQSQRHTPKKQLNEIMGIVLDHV